MTGISVLLGRGGNGLPPPEPVEFGTLVLPASPNTCLAAPPGAHRQAQLTTPPLPVAAATAWPLLLAVGDAQPRTTRLAAWPDRFQAQWVQRSALANFPDIIVAELASGPAGAGLFLYSRSLFGYSDFGVNRRRVEVWLAAMDAALRRG
jgi:uncharacterized protein (DUF1499 family)